MVGQLAADFTGITGFIFIILFTLETILDLYIRAGSGEGL